MTRKRIGEVLVEAGAVTSQQLRAALAEQRRWGGPIGRHLVESGALTEDALVVALARQLGLPTVDLDACQIEGEVVDLNPLELAELHGIIPLRVEGHFLDLAMIDPTNLGVIDEVRIRTHLNVRQYLAGPKATVRALGRLYGASTQFFSGGMAIQPKASVFPLNTRVVDLEPAATSGGPPPAPEVRDLVREVSALQGRVQRLESIIARDEEVLRRVLALIIDKGLASRDEIAERMSG